MPQNRKTVCYYISGHGYGHAARASQVISALPADVKVIVRSAVDAKFFARECTHKVEVLPGQFDTGVLQKDNLTLDWPATIAAAKKLSKQCSANLLEETDLLRKRKVDVVVSDVASAPLEAARLAGIPGMVVGNFTWVEIFEREAKDYPDAGKLAELWKEQYGLASLGVRTPPAFPMKYFRATETVELVARKGKNIRPELLKLLSASKNARLVLLYFGTFGDDNLTIPTIPDTHFLSFTAMPTGVTQLDPKLWHFPDVVASVNCVIAKPGYGTIGECMANATPVVYHPRPEFAEYRILHKAITEWGGGVQISRKDLTSGRWNTAITNACQLKPKRVKSGGANQVASKILELIGEQD